VTPRSTIKRDLIAPCGMNCGICSGYLLSMNPCPGCRGDVRVKSDWVRKCNMANCEERTGKYCFQCDEYPCKRVRHIDKRYRTKYHMSMLENLDYIKEHGINEFVRNEKERWACSSCGGMICCHKGHCVECGEEM
jgi:hypothetical protein